MIDANKGANEETLWRLRDESHERFRVELFKSVEQLLIDFEMTWDDLAKKLGWIERGGDEIKQIIGSQDGMTLKDLNALASVFSAEPYVIFRPRFPWTGS